MQPTRLGSLRSLRRAILAGTAASLACGASAPAAQYLYTPNNALTDLWSAGTNWSGAPLSAVDTRLTFVGTNTDLFADALNNLNTCDLPGQFQLNILDLQGTGANSGGTLVKIATASPATGLTLISNGATTPVVNLNALAGASGLTYDVAAPVTLASNTLFTGAGTANFSFSGGLSGSAVTLTKSGASTLRLGGASTLGVLDAGINTAGGGITLLGGASLSVVSSGSNLRIGVSGVATAASATFDASAAASFTASVANVQIGITGNNNVSAQGIVNLAALNDITASASFVVGNSGGAQNNVTSSVNTPAGSSTTVRTPSFVIGGSKARGTFTLGAGATFDLTGIGALTPTTGRTSLGVSSMSVGGGSGTYSGTMDVSAGSFHANLNGLFVGNQNTASSSSSSTGVLTLGSAGSNHLDIVGANNVVVVGRQQVSTATGVATGTLTLASLDSTSSVTTTTAGATAILVGSALTAGKAVGTLNLNGGTLSVSTTGAAIGGTSLGTSTVNFNGTTIRSLQSSSTWVSNLTTALVGAGGAKFDTNGFINTIPQPLLHDPALDALGATPDGGFTKSGNGTLILTGINTYTGITVVSGGILQAAKTSALPGFNLPGQIFVVGTGGLGMNVGGPGEWTAADIDTLRNNAQFSGMQSLGFDTTNAPGNFTYGTPLDTIFSLSKSGAPSLTLDTGATTFGSVNIGINNNGGSVLFTAGQTVSVGTGPSDNLNLGITTTAAAAAGTLNASNATSFTANVLNIVLGSAQNNGVTAQGTLSLPANNTITAIGSITVGVSAGAFNNVTSAISIAAGGATTILTPFLNVGSTKSRGTFTVGTGAVVNLAGPGGTRTQLNIGRGQIEGGSGGWFGSADFSAGTLSAQLGNVVIGYADAGTLGTWTEDGSLILGASAANHLDVSGVANPVIVGRWIGGGAGSVATGTLTIGNLDATSSIVALDNSTAILLGTGGPGGTQRATGTLNLNGGTLTITTTGLAIGGDPVNTANVSTVNFNGTTLKAGASSTNWIGGLTNANVGAGGAKFDTNGNDLTIAQVLVHSAALDIPTPTPDGGLTKSGNGTLTLSGANTYNGITTVAGGTLAISGSLSGTTEVTAGTLTGPGMVGAVHVSAGGTLAPGAGLGTMTSGPLSFSGGTLAIDIDTGFLTADLLTVSGDFNVGTGSPSLVVTDLNADFLVPPNMKLLVLSYSGAWDGHFFQVNGATVPDGGTFTVGSNTFTLDYNDAGGLVSFTAVPEPAAGAMLLLGLGCMLKPRRRQRNSPM